MWYRIGILQLLEIFPKPKFQNEEPHLYFLAFGTKNIYILFFKLNLPAKIVAVFFPGNNPAILLMFTFNCNKPIF